MYVVLMCLVSILIPFLWALNSMAFLQAHVLQMMLLFILLHLVLFLMHLVPLCVLPLLMCLVHQIVR